MTETDDRARQLVIQRLLTMENGETESKKDSERVVSEASILSSANFDASWGRTHARIFRFADAPQGEPWLPDQVFKDGFRFSFIYPYDYFREHTYEILRAALQQLCETKYVIGPADGSAERDQYPFFVYSSLARYEDYLQGKDELDFFVNVQPLEFYMHGQRDDWGIVASEGYNIAIIGYRSTAAASAFTGNFLDDFEELRRTYFPLCPPEYRHRFEEHYFTQR